MPLIRILLTGDCLSHVADNKSLEISKAAAGDCVHRFCNAIIHHMGDFVRFPSTDKEVQQTIEDFYEIRGRHSQLAVVVCYTHTCRT